MFQRLTSLVLLAFAVGIAGCSRGGMLPVADGGSSPSAGAVAQTVMYVASFNGVQVFDTAFNLLYTIGHGVDIPSALAVDKQGTLYVANGAGGPHGQGAIEVYSRGATKPARTINAGLNGPFALALDSKGNLYVANQYGNSVTVYAPGSTRVLRTIADNLSYPVALAFDRNDNLFVASSGNGGWITEYSPGGTTASRTITSGIKLPLWLAVDASGNLYVANDFGNSVTTYRPGQTAPWRTIQKGIGGPQSLVLGSNGELYVGNYRGGVVKLDAAGREVSKIQTPYMDPRDLAIDPSGNLVVADHGINNQRGGVIEYSKTNGKRLYEVTRKVLSPAAVVFGPR